MAPDPVSIIHISWGGPERWLSCAGRLWVFEDHPYCGPIVLTGHEVFTLSRTVGRDVHAELFAICGERYEASTLGQLMRLLTERLSAERQHIGGEGCWCGPTVEFRFPSGTPAIWVHKQVQ